jgi:hypothetical protein
MQSSTDEIVLLKILGAKQILRACLLPLSNQQLGHGQPISVYRGRSNFIFTLRTYLIVNTQKDILKSNIKLDYDDQLIN